MGGDSRIVTSWSTIAGRDGAAFDAYVARPAQGSGPPVIVVPDAYGINRAVRRICGELAEEGYVAVAPDVLWRRGRRIELDLDEAGFARAAALRAHIDPTAALADVADCIAAVRRMPGCV